MSASRSPTSAPSAARARARLTATVDFPTPPLPDAIAMTFLIPSSNWTFFCTAWATICHSTATDADSTPGIAASSASRAWPSSGA